jgi:2-oxoglutarate ferredoxin oxidoreductase subunit alpha
VIINVQRGGPSTGLPTKTEQADLFQALFGRNGEAPVPVIAAQTPGDCFFAAFEACQVAIKYRTPVFMLSDGYLANGSEPWSIPNFDDLPSIHPDFSANENGIPFMPYARDEKTLARPWAIPGTPGLEHRIGGLEKEDMTGNVSYDPENHHHMTELRAQKVANITQDIPPTEILGAASGDLLILSWGGTYGSCRSAIERLQNEGKKVSLVHLRWLNPLPKDLGEILIRFKNILIPELNMGQLSKVVRAEYLVDAQGLNLVRGRPFRAADIVTKAQELIG